AGSFAAAVLLLAIGAGLGARTARGRWAAGSVGVLALVQVGLSLSRGAWIGCIAGFLALLILQRRARRALTRLAPPLLLALVVAATLTPAASELQIVGERFTSIGSADKNPYDDRTTIWGEALREFHDSPWLGQGPGAFPYVSSRLASRARTVSALHAHDLPLHVAAELGGPGVVLVFGFTLSLGFAALRASRRLNEVDGSLAAGVGAALATFVGQGLFDVTLLSALIATLLWFLVGLALALSVVRPAAEGGTLPT
ncbi:MAG: O-antigen ligase family protein, partial [Mycobacteriales bacterium]